MPIEKVRPHEAVAAMRASAGKFFTVHFKKRTTGEDRVMTCRLGVTKHLKGGEKPYDAAANNLLTVFDTTKSAYRNINLLELTRVVIDGKTLEVG